MENNIELSLTINNRVRIQVLYDVIKELSYAFNFPEYVITTLYKGIVERQIIKYVVAYYIDNNGKSVGLVRFNIDWKMHKLHAETSTGKYIQIRYDKPLVEQFALWATDIIAYIQNMQNELKIEEVEVQYRLIDEIINDPIAHKDAQEFLNLSTSKKQIKIDTAKGQLFERKMKFVSEILPELEIEIESNK